MTPTTRRYTELSWEWDPNEQITVNTAPGMTTQASPTSATVGVGITATDTATFVGTTSVAPTGDVTFTLFSNSNCSTTVPGVGGTGMIQTTGGVSTATYSVNWTPLTPGTYSWIASYPGDGNNQASETNCSDANEQITVNAASPGMTTKASPATATVGVAVSTLTDTATLTGGDFTDRDGDLRAVHRQHVHHGGDAGGGRDGRTWRYLGDRDDVLDAAITGYLLLAGHLQR